MTTERSAQVQRKTKEVEVSLSLNLDGTGQTAIDTGLGFFDHMLHAMSYWAGWDLELSAKGDLVVDDHHTAEDVALCLGQGFRQALGDGTNFTRFSEAIVPLDEALVRTVVDVSNRPYCAVSLSFSREQIGGLATENIVHFFRSFATEARITLHIDELRGENDHHRSEAAFKSVGIALRRALAIDPLRASGGASTKGVL